MSDIKLDIEIEDGKVKRSAKEIESQFNKTGKSIQSGIGASIAKVATGAAVAAAAIKGLSLIKDAFTDGILAAQVQEDAINRLNSSLIATNKFSSAASQDFQKFASSLQDVSRFGDEVILDNAALVQSLGNLGKQGLKQATQAALDLSSALKIDLRSAATLVGKAASGEVSSFSRYGVVIKKGSDNAETFTNTLTALNSKFGGAAARDVETFSGAIKQLTNVVGDGEEELGKFFTEARGITEVIKLFTEFRKKANADLKAFLAQFDLLDDVLIPLARFAKNIVRFVVQPIEAIVRVVKASLSVAANLFDLWVNGVISAVSTVGGVLGKVITFFKPESGLGKALNDFNKNQTGQFGKAFTETVGNIKGEFTSLSDIIGEGTLSDNMTMVADTVIGKLKEISANAKIVKEDIVAAIPVEQAAEKLITFGEVGEDVFSSFKNKLDFTDKNVKKTNEGIKEFAKQAGTQLRTGFAQSAGSAFAEFGAALANGDNALKAFTQSLIKSIGEQAIALGTKFILEGTAYLFSPGFQGLGAGLIASGAALAAFGGAVSALSGGGSSSGASGASPGSTPLADSTTIAESSEPDNLERASVGTVLNLTVQGNIVDQGAFVQSIANDIGDAIQGQGLTIRGINA